MISFLFIATISLNNCKKQEKKAEAPAPEKKADAPAEKKADEHPKKDDAKADGEKKGDEHPKKDDAPGDPKKAGIAKIDAGQYLDSLKKIKAMKTDKEKDAFCQNLGLKDMKHFMDHHQEVMKGIKDPKQQAEFKKQFDGLSKK